MTARRDSALLVVDMQKDFGAGGSLPVANADRVALALTRYIDVAVANGTPVYASRDWHPVVSAHFTPYGGPWPPHCVKGTDGARFHPDLRLPTTAIIVSKGQDPGSHGYSAFDGSTPAGRMLLVDLRERGVKHLFVGGVATDFCVKHSVLDALAAGFDVTLLEDAIAGVDPSASELAVAQMRLKGARLTSGPELLSDCAQDEMMTLGLA